MYDVRPIDSKRTYPLLLRKHYAKRLPPISHAFGLFEEGGTELLGVVTYGTPMSSTLKDGLCGPEHASKVLELNRLCLNDGVAKGAAGILVSRSIRMLPKPSIVVSYADTGNGHVGYVYQATNFLYTGLSADRVDYKIRGEEHLHNSTIGDRSRGKKDRIGWLRETYGDRFYVVPRDRKHRYVLFWACTKKIRRALKYPILPYPKGETKRHNTDVNVQDTALPI